MSCTKGLNPRYPSRGQPKQRTGTIARIVTKTILVFSNSNHELLTTVPQCHPEMCTKLLRVIVNKVIIGITYCTRNFKVSWYVGTRLPILLANLFDSLLYYQGKKSSLGQFYGKA